MSKVEIITIERSSLEQMIKDSLHTIISKLQPEFFTEEEVLTWDEAAAFLKISRSTLNNRVKDGTIKLSRATGDPRFLKSELVQIVREGIAA